MKKITKRTQRSKTDEQCRLLGGLTIVGAVATTVALLVVDKVYGIRTSEDK